MNLKQVVEKMLSDGVNRYESSIEDIAIPSSLPFVKSNMVVESHLIRVYISVFRAGDKFRVSIEEEEAVWSYEIQELGLPYTLIPTAPDETDEQDNDELLDLLERESQYTETWLTGCIGGIQDETEGSNE